MLGIPRSCQKKYILRGIVESIGVTYVGKTQYSIDKLIYFILSTYNRIRQDFQLTSISTVTKLTSKVTIMVRLFLVH